MRKGGTLSTWLLGRHGEQRGLEQFSLVPPAETEKACLATQGAADSRTMTKTEVSGAH